MKIVTSLSAVPFSNAPIALTIGIFDGIHVGHQTIINKLHRLTRQGGTRTVLTFSNHPAHILNPTAAPTPLLISFEHRLHLLQKYGIDLVIALPFTREFAQQAYSEFLINLHQCIPFNDLVLGEDATFGKDGKGDAAHLQEFSKKLGFYPHYLKKKHYYQEITSSGLIRTLVLERKLRKIKTLLGRPYSIWRVFHAADIKKENETLYSWTFEESTLCMLPSGVYGIDFEAQETAIPAIAFIQSRQDTSGLSCIITVYFGKKPQVSSAINLAFTEYLHAELDPHLFHSTSASILKDLSTQPSLS